MRWLEGLPETSMTAGDYGGYVYPVRELVEKILPVATRFRHSAYGIMDRWAQAAGFAVARDVAGEDVSYTSPHRSVFVHM